MLGRIEIVPMQLRPIWPLASSKPRDDGAAAEFRIRPAFLHVLRLAETPAGRRFSGLGTLMRVGIKSNDLVYLVNFLLPLTSFEVNIKVLC